MHPVLFDFGPVTIQWYGVLFATGFLAAAIHWSLLGRRAGFEPGFGIELCIWVIVSSVIGARTAFVIANWSVFAEEPIRVIRLDGGGLIFYGGLIGAAVAVPLLARLRRIPFWTIADYTISAVPLGHGIGRIGCFLNGCCYGAQSDSFWAVPLDGVFRHPVPLFEALFSLAVYIVLLQLYLRNHRQGRVLAAYLMLYPAGRFGLEFLRGDVRLEGFLASVAQEVSLLLILVGALLWFGLPRQHPPRRRHADDV